MSTLAPVLTLAFPRLSSDLISPGAVSRIRQLAAALPPIPWAGFECRLGENQIQVDLQQGVDREGAHLGLFLDYLEARRIEEGAAFPSAWLRIYRFCQQWRDSTTLLHSNVSSLGLEFDISDYSQQEQIPSLFLALSNELPPDEGWATTWDALGYLLDKPLSDAVGSNLELCFAGCPPEAKISFVGIMLSRPLDAVRVNVRGLARDQMIPYLQRVSWPGVIVAAEALIERLFPFADHITLCLDAGARIYPSLGLECFFDEQPEQEPRWVDLLEHLVDSGLCTAPKRDGLLAWPGRITPLNCTTPWPETLIVESLRQKRDHFELFRCWLNHIKVAYHPHCSLQAKAYLGFRQCSFLPRPVNDETKRTTAAPISILGEHRDNAPKPLDQRRVMAAMAAAVSFLMGARDQRGWWSDFQLPAGGSDEWVTAYVGTVLAAMPQERLRQAASRSWALLSARRGPAEGWGYNALTPTDGDSTTWALRLAQAVGSAQTARALGARRFLERHVCSDGGVTTYADEAPIRAYYEELAPPVPFSGWLAAHACVTAAVAHVEGLGQRTLPYLRSKQSAAGYWLGYWWCDPEYTTALAVEALVGTDRHADRQQVERAVGWATRRIRQDGSVHSDVHGGASAFATAWSLRILAQAMDLMNVRQPLERGVSWLLSSQRSTGSWSPSAWMRVPPPNAVNPEPHPAGTLVVVDRKAIFTTATVLTALEVARTRLLSIIH